MSPAGTWGKRPCLSSVAGMRWGVGRGQGLKSEGRGPLYALYCFQLLLENKWKKLEGFKQRSDTHDALGLPGSLCGSVQNRIRQARDYYNNPG